jgi:large subunit ribosomal protein L19
MSQQLLNTVEKPFLKAEPPKFAVGDTVDVHMRILEEIDAKTKKPKYRTQIFSGTVIAKSGSGTREMFTVRRIVSGEGVERKFPLHTPDMQKVEVKRSGVTRRAKLYYLRDRVGKGVKLREKKVVKGE